MSETSQADAERLAALKRNVFFVVGCGRSGTSLLRAMIATHPEAHVVNESLFCHSVYRKEHKRLQAYQGGAFVDQAIASLFDNWWIREMNLDRESVRRFARAEGAHWGGIYLGLLAAAADVEKARIVGDKTPTNVRYIALLSQWFPECKFIHIVRDPRAVVSSHLESSHGSKQIGPAIENWVGAVRSHRKHSVELGDNRYLLVRYEDLVAEPHEQLTNLCGFLGLEFVDDMMRYHQRGPESLGIPQAKLGHMSNVLKPVFQSSLEKWRHQRTSSEIGLVEYACGDGMEMLGYEPEGVTVRLPELKLWISHVKHGWDHVVKRYLNQPNRRAA